METAKERLEKILLYTNKSAKSLAQAIDAKPQQMYDISREKTGKFPVLLADRIVKHFPEINRIWLITGEGEMLGDTVVEAEQKNISIPPEVWKTISELAAAVKSQQEELRELRAGAGTADKKVAGL